MRGPLKISEAVAGEQVSVAVLGHPMRPAQMAFPRMPRSVERTGRIDVQNDASDWANSCVIIIGRQREKAEATLRVAARTWLEMGVAQSGNMKLSFQAARSIG